MARTRKKSVRKAKSVKDVKSTTQRQKMRKKAKKSFLDKLLDW